MDFQKIGKKSGEPYDILDDKIAEYVAHKQLRVFIITYIGEVTIYEMRTEKY